VKFLAPIALFTYNRPAHTRRTLETLAANPLARDSQLVAFSDGPRTGDEGKVAEVRAVLRERAWCGEVRIAESPVNRGLAASIISGVTELLREHDRLIVLEDDLALSPGFLAYMNAGLERYAGDERVMSVAGYLPPLKGELPPAVFSAVARRAVAIRCGPVLRAGARCRAPAS
jgi:GT2 family glycosyltransferase